MLEIDQLTVAYGARLALRDFSLSMQEGEIVALVGRAAAAKPRPSAPSWASCRQAEP